jgi:hypothetical protein
MATSVRTFCRAHPSDDTSFTLVLDRLNSTILRIEELATQQESGYVSKHAATERRKDLRRRLQTGLLRHVVTAAEVAGRESVQVAGKFRLPGRSATHAVFRAAASEILGQARVYQEILAKHGLSVALLDDLDTAIKEFDSSLQESSDGKQDHVLARAEMKVLGDEIMQLVGMLDGFNRNRFHRDPELIVAWQSAKRIVRGPQPKESGPAAPAAPEVEKPAA